MRTVLIYILAILLVFALAFAISCFEAWIFMLLWNWIIPLIWVNAPTFSFWIAFGILILVNLLFGGTKAITVKTK
jgi:hypothetical protein